jgi:putative transposase
MFRMTISIRNLTLNIEVLARVSGPFRLEEARQFCVEFFPWYNHQHHHSGLHLMTPVTVHYGQAEEVSRRQSVLDAAYQAHPERFVKRPSQHPSLPEAVWINPPVSDQGKTP